MHCSSQDRDEDSSTTASSSDDEQDDDELNDEDGYDGKDFNNVADLDTSWFKPMFDDEGTILILRIGFTGSTITYNV